VQTKSPLNFDAGLTAKLRSCKGLSGSIDLTIPKSDCIGYYLMFSQNPGASLLVMSFNRELVFVNRKHIIPEDPEPSSFIS
jgi:hypothetical protein